MNDRRNQPSICFTIELSCYNILKQFTTRHPTKEKQSQLLFAIYIAICNYYYYNYHYTTNPLLSLIAYHYYNFFITIITVIIIIMMIATVEAVV